jgi:DNA-directed RNA polymerase specialized sigma24 family protein
VELISVPKETSRDFGVLFDMGYRRLARLLYRVTGDAGSAEEIAAEAFIRLHRKPPAAKIKHRGMALPHWVSAGA